MKIWYLMFQIVNGERDDQYIVIRQSFRLRCNYDDVYDHDVIVNLDTKWRCAF